MSASAFTILNTSKRKLVDGTFDLDTHTWKVALLTASVAMTAASTVDTYAEITSQVANGGGYTTGGATLASVSVTTAGSTVTFDAADVTWNGTITAKYAILYSDTATAKDILGYVDLDTTSGSSTVSSTAADFAINWNPAGIFTLT